jgi:PAS domain S-box-containing protein
MNDTHVQFSRDRLIELLDTLEQIAGGRTHLRLPISGNRDEFDAMAYGINVLVGELRRSMARTLVAQRAAEKQRTEIDARENDERFRWAMNSVALGVYTLDEHGLVTYMNPAAEGILGWTATELRGRNIHDVVHYKRQDDTPIPAGECRVLRVLQDGIEVCECADTYIRRDGSFFPVVYSSSPLIKDGRIAGLVVGFRDDTHRQKAEGELRDSEGRFRQIANAAPVMIWITDVKGQVTYFNHTWLNFTGLTIEEASGAGWEKATHPDDVERCRDAYLDAAARREPFRVEQRLQRYDGKYRWTLTTGAPRYSPNGLFMGYIGTGTDVTEQKLAQEALSTVSQRLIEAQEEERARISREIHDDINQRLALLSFALGDLEKDASLLTGDVKEKISQISQEVFNLGRELQFLSHRLHPPKLEYLGLDRAAASLCEEVSAQQGVKVRFRSMNVPRDIPPRIALCIYRVLQEALQNALKHSDAKRAGVTLYGDGDRIELTVRDSGIGFDPEDAIKGRGLGLASVNERLKAVGGQLTIVSAPKRGTRIHALVPLKSSTFA